jgi:hypothetical protein
MPALGPKNITLSGLKRHAPEGRLGRGGPAENFQTSRGATRRLDSGPFVTERMTNAASAVGGTEDVD